jgi:hypothetical protein
VALSLVGVPEIAPVVVLKLSPLGRLGFRVQELIKPPAFVGVRLVIAVFTVPLIVVGDIVISGNAGALNTSVTVAVSLPPRPDAVTT